MPLDWSPKPFFEGQLARVVRPLPSATSRCLLSGETATAVGYQPTGINPFTTEIFSSPGASSDSDPEMSTTMTLFWSALATNNVFPSGDTATPHGVAPSGDCGYNEVLMISRVGAHNGRAGPAPPGIGSSLAVLEHMDCIVSGTNDEKPSVRAEGHIIGTYANR